MLFFRYEALFTILRTFKTEIQHNYLFTDWINTKTMIGFHSFGTIFNLSSLKL